MTRPPGLYRRRCQARRLLGGKRGGGKGEHRGDRGGTHTILNVCVLHNEDEHARALFRRTVSDDLKRNGDEPKKPSLLNDLAVLDQLPPDAFSTAFSVSAVFPAFSLSLS